MMLLEQLVQYAERLEREGKTLPFMYQETPVPWIVKLDAAGNFLDLERTSDGLGKKADRGKPIPAPKLKRTGAKASLLADDLEYVFDLSNSETTPEMRIKAAEKRSLFIEETRACLNATEHPDVKAVLMYLEQLPANTPQFPEGTTLKEKVTFEVEGRRVIAQEKVQAFWASKYADDAEDAPETSSKDAPLIAECLITGQVGPVMRREPLPIKGGLIPNGHTAGMGFISADKKPFESYGLRNSEIAPVRTEAAVKYATALNTLLEQPHTHLRVNPVVFAFWTRNVPTPDVPGLLKKPAGHELLQKLKSGQGIASDLQVQSDANQVRRMISSAFTGNVFADLPPDEFYCVSLSAYTSRVVVRNHITSTIREIGENLTAYLNAQRLIDTEPFGVFELAASLYRDANKEQTAQTVSALLEFALQRGRLPQHYLNNLANRNRAEQRITKPRAVLTRMTLISMEEIRMDELIALQPDHKSPGYQLGRLMAALENLQWLALVKYGSSSKINTTVTDRFYSSLSSTPALVFANVMAGAQDHLSRIRKSDPGAFSGEDKRIGQILGHVQTVPDVLEPVDQAFFSLGYYHEKADRFARIQEAKDKKDSSDPNEGGNQ
jgi:CRISPR-associated protein Csd1